MTAGEFAAQCSVSRETLDGLEALADLLARWTQRINLVSKSTLPDLWRRHILDSAQLVPHIPPDARTLVDLGSGGGFPGLVLAAMTDLDIHLVESDVRKCAFLREGARTMGRSVTIHTARIENLPPLRADIVTARALASLSQLLDFARPLRTDDGICLFLKGTTLQTELTEAKKIWHIDSTQHRSLSDPSSWILRVGAFRRVEPDKYQP